VNGPITVAIVDDYDVVVMGLANMFDQYSDRVVVAELDSNEALVDTVDIVLRGEECKLSSVRSS
jgi:DNA-binding NarL/FixJ family response regulator